MAIPTNAINFFTKFGELMSKITSAEAFYGTDLKMIHSEVSSLYWRWSKVLIVGKSTYEFSNELVRLEFSTCKKICEDIIKRSSQLEKELNRLFLIDTSQLSVAIEKARQQKVVAERSFIEGKPEGAIKLMQGGVDSHFKAYSEWKAKRKNLERNALMKWCGVLGGGYSGGMLIYLQILAHLHIERNYTLGVIVPVTVGLLMLLLLVAIFSRE